MQSLIDLIGTHIPQIAGALIMAAIGFYLAGLNKRKDRFADACIKFRNEVLTSLESVYPSVSVYLSAEEVDTRILQSIPKITTAATAFRHHLPFYRRSGFDRATQFYSSTARNTDWNNKRAYEMFPSMQAVGDVTPGAKFKHLVDAFLFYAKEN